MNFFRHLIVTTTFLMCFISTTLAADQGRSAAVQTAMLSHHTISETLTGYGVVIADTGEETSIALPRTGRLATLNVMPGQQVRRGEELFEFATSAADSLAYGQARTAVEFARGEVQRNESLFEQKLVTAAQLAAARKTFADAESALTAQSLLGSGQVTEKLIAPFDGVVTAISATQGDFLAAGVPVLKLMRAGKLRVQIGIEPEDVARVKIGMPVRISSVFNESRILNERVYAVLGTINPQTKLVDVTVKLDNTAHGFLLGTRVRGDITVTLMNALVAPRSAVLKDEKGAYLFQVKNGRAMRVEVQPGVENGRLVAVNGALDLALPVVILGNYELEDGMPVRGNIP